MAILVYMDRCCNLFGKDMCCYICENHCQCCVYTKYK